MSHRGFASISPRGSTGSRTGPVLNELVIPAVRDGGAFTSIRGFLGNPAAGNPLHGDPRPLLRAGVRKLDRLRQQVEAGKVTLRVAALYPAEKAGDAPAGWRLTEPGAAGHPVLILPADDDRERPATSPCR